MNSANARLSVVAVLIGSAALGACGKPRDKAELRNAVEDRVDAARTEIGGTVEARVDGKVQAVQTAGVDNAVASAVAAAASKLDSAMQVSGWIITTGAAVTEVVAAQKALADDAALLADPDWQTRMTNGVAGVRMGGEEALALAALLASEGKLPAVQKSLVEIGDELTSAAERLDVALASGSAADVAAATPNLSSVLAKVKALHALLAAPPE